MKYYYSFQTLRTKTWISTSKRKQLNFNSHILDEITDGWHVEVTHKVYESDFDITADFGMKIGDCICNVPNEQLPEIIERFNMKFIGHRIGWTGWQKGMTKSDKKFYIAKARVALNEV